MAFARRTFFMLFRGPRWVGYEQVPLFLPAQSEVNFFLWVGHIAMADFVSSVTTKVPARFKIKSTSLPVPASPLAVTRSREEHTPRAIRCDVMSRLHASKGIIVDPMPSKPQEESGELKEQVIDSLMFA